MSDEKRPAFRFYVADFLLGVQTMTGAQIGSYVLMLCYQWDNGFIPDDPKELSKIAKCPAGVAQAILLKKFPVWPDGKHRNERMERERKKAEEYANKQSQKGTAGAKKRWEKDSTGNAPAIAQAMPVAIPKHGNPVSVSVSLLAEREPDLPECDEPGEKEVKFYAQQIGLAEWRALDWLNEMKGCGWLDHQHRPVRDWRAILVRVKVKWEADGRPMQPPTSYKPPLQAGPQGSTTADKILHQKEYERVIERMRVIKGQYDHFQDWSDQDKAEWQKLKVRKQELKQILGITI